MHRRLQGLIAEAQPRSVLRYGLAVLMNMLALLLTWLLLPFLERSIFIIFFAAVAINARFVNFVSALFTIGFAALTIGYFFIPPVFSLAVGIQGGVPVLVFTSIAFLISSLTESRKRAEQRARMEAARFRVTLASIGDAVIVTDTAGRVTFLNDVAALLTGWPQAQAIGHDIAEVFCIVNEDTGQPVESPVVRVLREGTVVGLANHTRLIAKDGIERPIADSGAPIRDANREIIGVVMVFRDITERVQVERERAELLVRERQARIAAEQALALRDQFLSLAAHELKTPLTSILGNIELFKRRASREQGLSERMMQTFNVIEDQTNRLNRMVFSLLDVSRIERGQLTLERQPVDVCALVRRIVNEIQPTLSERQIWAHCNSEPLVIQGDELRLEQVLQNLIQNAEKYSAPNAPIAVEVSQHGRHVCVVVRDTGIGIPQSALSHVFERFYRAPNVDQGNISGTGIGLYVVKQIVELHGGEIRVESIEGKGSTFIVSLPLDDA
jgi:PAS domain S-box-containing protein